MTDETYNGWSNYPTWAVNLWLSNDEGLYGEAMQLVDELIARPEEEFIPPRVAVADTLKDWVTNDLAPDLGASFAADLLGFALDQVDWLEITDALIEDVAQLRDS